MSITCPQTSCLLLLLTWISSLDMYQKDTKMYNVGSTFVIHWLSNKLNSHSFNSNNHDNSCRSWNQQWHTNYGSETFTSVNVILNILFILFDHFKIQILIGAHTTWSKTVFQIDMSSWLFYFIRALLRQKSYRMIVYKWKMCFFLLCLYHWLVYQDSEFSFVVSSNKVIVFLFTLIFFPSECWWL